MGKQTACMQELLSQKSLCYRQLCLEFFCCSSLTQCCMNAVQPSQGGGSCVVKNK